MPSDQCVLLAALFLYGYPHHFVWMSVCKFPRPDLARIGIVGLGLGPVALPGFLVHGELRYPNIGLACCTTTKHSIHYRYYGYKRSNS